MAGLDHDVHERTRINSDFRWGCWNLPRNRHPLVVKNGFRVINEDNGRYAGEQMFKVVCDFGSSECRNDISLKDPKCQGCKYAGSGEAYAEFVRANGT